MRMGAEGGLVVYVLKVGLAMHVRDGWPRIPVLEFDSVGIDPRRF